MMRRLIKVLAGLLLLLAIAVGGLLWRLDQGPLSLAFMQPVLQWVVDRGSPYATTFSEPMLVWLRQQDELALQVRTVELRTPEGALVASAPLVRASVAAAPLVLQQRLELVEVKAELPTIELKRDRDRRLVLYFDQRIAGVPLGEAAGGGGLGTLLGDTGEVKDPRLASLRLVRVSAPSLQFLDEVTAERATASNAVFELNREGAVWSALLQGDIGGGSLAVRGAPTTTPGRPDVTMELRNLRAKDYVAFAPSVPLAGLDVPVSGTVRFPLDAMRGELGEVAIDVTFGGGNIAVTTLGLPPIAVKQGVLRGSVAAGWQAATIDRLEVTAEAFTLGASGSIAVDSGNVSANIVADADALDVADVLRLWPTEVGSGARDWIAANVTAGQLKGISFRIDEHGSRPGQPDLGGSFTFTGGVVRYLDTMPPAERLAGSASLAGNSLQVKLTAGRTGEVELGRGTVTLTNLIGDAVGQLKVNVDLRSSVPAAMRLLDAEPVALGKATGLRADRASGGQTTRLEVGLPLLDDIPPARIRWKAASTLTELELRDLLPGYTLAAASLALTADPAAVAVKGDVRLNGTPLAVDFRENTPPVRGVSRTVKVTGRIDAAGARALRVDWPEEVRGEIGLDAAIVEGGKPLRSVDLALDLRGASIEMPGLLIAKRPGEAGHVSARLVQADEKHLAVEQGRAELAGWEAQADADLRLEPVQAERIALRRLRGPLGDLTADLQLDGRRWRGRVDVDRLDLRPVLQAGSGASGGDGPDLPDFLVQVTARQLRLGDAPFSNLAGTVQRQGGMWQSAKLTANIEDSQVRLDVDTPTRQTAAILRGSDAGWLIRGFAATDNGIRGGTFRLSADLSQSGSAISGSGDLKIRDFTLWGAPAIARIISLASFSGLSNALAGRGVPVTRLIVPFRLDDRLLTIEQARMVGSDIGARAEGTIDFANDRLAITGTVAPAYTVNRILGRIPIIGQILSGSQSDAALAATFSVSGPLSQPQIGVNPLAALVPGMIRDLFSAFTADTAESGRIDER